MRVYSKGFSGEGFRSRMQGSVEDLGVSQNHGYHFGGPNNKDYSILGSMLESPYFGKLPFSVQDLEMNSGLGFRFKGLGLRLRVQGTWIWGQGVRFGL